MNKILKYLLLGFVAFSFLQCACPWKGENSIYGNYPSKTSIQAGDEWQNLESNWKFYEEAELVIIYQDNSSVKGLWFAEDERLEVILGDETISYSISEINANKIQLISGITEITLNR